MGISLLIFDLDGTLIDSAPDLCTAVNLALAELSLTAHSLDAVRRMVGDGQRTLIERALRAAGGEPAVLHLETALPRFRHHYAEHLLEQTRLYPAVRETLTALPAELPQAVATNKPGGWARRLTAELGLVPPLRWVLGEGDVGQRKPHPRLIEEICARAGVAPAETLFVGDSLVDWRTAQAAGTQFVMCTYGYCDDQTLADARAAAQLDAPGPSLAARPLVIEEIAHLVDHVARSRS